ncbi:dimethylallyl tryptophan synthase [Sphaerosporella brunnea]|uniref:Dimethylallyl tryptophan synthase n=1 Tax=Sphaerosporella brunnea TaxID=1250544 RepID=A0A5J5EF40_9PEZI|nr:dimethylallyl tryptophan synthase [Sphaerosporella brunnea]
MRTMTDTQVNVDAKEMVGGEDLSRILVSSPSPQSVHDLPSATAVYAWPSILAPYLSTALTHRGSYTESEILHHTAFFAKHVSSWLGPGPTGSNRAQYPSSMTKDYTPFELSFCWKSAQQNGTPIVRYVIDIFPQDPTSDRRGSLSRALDAIASLNVLSKEPDNQLSVFPELWSHVTRFFMSIEATLHATPCESCRPSSTFIGFDLVATQTRAKLYWLLPSCQSTPDLLQTIDQLFETCASVNPFFASTSFTAGWSQLREHVAANAESLRPRMVSIDATRWPAPRVKFYTRCVFAESNNGFGVIRPHLTLDGKLSLESDFENTCERLWEGLVQKEGEKRSKYCMLLWDIGVEGTVGSKLYIMCQEIPRTDVVVAGKVLECCRASAGAGLLEAFAAKDTPSAFIGEIGLAPRGAETEVSIYASPCWFSKDLWKEGEDEEGLLEKICPYGGMYGS